MKFCRLKSVHGGGGEVEREELCVNKWSAPGGLVSLRSFRKHILHYNYIYNGYRILYNQARNLFAIFGPRIGGVG